MKWLQWSTINLEKGIGGVEVHARSVARELRKKGIEVAFSNRSGDLDNAGWDVIHTHGSTPAPKRKTKAIRVHTLHGTTLGRMAACGEWTWPGGYLAALREWKGVKSADVVVAVHPSLWLFAAAKKLGKCSTVCWNGWDSWNSTEEVSALQRIDGLPEGKPFWAYVGRGSDRVKNVKLLKATMKLFPDIPWVAAPGEGFDDSASVVKTGNLTNAQIRRLLSMSTGLALCSKYEGNPLVILEALSLGVPVVSTKVGAVPQLPRGLQGMIMADAHTPQAFAHAIRTANELSRSDREARAAENRKILPTWNQVAECYLNAVKQCHG